MPVRQRFRYGTAAALVGMCVLAGCGQQPSSARTGSSATPTRPAPTATYQGGWPREKGDHPGSALQIRTGSGYRYTLTSLGAGLTPQYGEHSAPPGWKFPYVVLLLHNALTDRTGPFSEGSDLAVAVPKAAGFEQDTGTCVDSMASGYCGESVVCGYQSTPGGQTRALDTRNGDSPDNVMAPGATWRVTCWPGADDVVYPVRDSVPPRQVRLFHRTAVGPDRFTEIRAGG